MNFIRGIKNLPLLPMGCILTMGNFDGVHLGHQALFQHSREAAKKGHLPTVAMVFEPQPLEYFQPDSAPARLTSLREKYYHIRHAGIDHLLSVFFNKSIVEMDARTFIENWLLQRLQVKHLIVGEDFRFGRQRAGTPELLKLYASQSVFSLTIVSNYDYNGERISSTAVREALATNQFRKAAELLGRPYAIIGKVAHGNELGRVLGFPTANIALRRIKPALKGVFLVEVNDITAQETYRGIANIGSRPTINGHSTLLEVNIFDFKKDIYGHELSVNFLAKIREEQKFASLGRLKAQITEDVCIAQKISAEF